MLKASYKDNEICPFYKPILKEDVLFDADISTYKYAARRAKELDAQMEEKERLIRSVNHTTSEVIKSIKKDLAAIKMALKTVEKEKKKAAEKIQQYEQQEEESYEHI